MYKLLSVSVLLLFLTAGCDQKPMYPKKHSKKVSAKNSSAVPSRTSDSGRTSEHSKKRKRSDTGVSDAADYFTGVTPLSTKKFAKKKLNNIYEKHNSQLEQKIKEK
jgi:hypothetical protein